MSLVSHLQYFLPRQSQIDLPGQLIAGAFKKLEQPKDFYKMATGLGAAVPGRHVQVWVADPKQEALVRQLGWDGALSQAKGDFLALAYEKRIAGKQDYWMRHTIDYDVAIKPSGAIDSTYTLHVSDEVTGGAPGRMVPHVRPYGLNVAMYNLYVPGRARFGSVSPNYSAFPTGFVSPSRFVDERAPQGLRAAHGGALPGVHADRDAVPGPSEHPPVPLLGPARRPADLGRPRLPPDGRRAAAVPPGDDEHHRAPAAAARTCPRRDRGGPCRGTRCA